MNSGLFCFALLLSGAAQLSAQYAVRQYAVRVEPDIYFGTADNFEGCPVSLYLDLYKWLFSLNSQMPVPNCFSDAGDPEWSPAVQVFPNPASGPVRVLLDSYTAQGLRAARLWSMDGRPAPLVAAKGPEGLAFESASLAPGVYVLVLETARGPVMRRVVAQ